MTPQAPPPITLGTHCWDLRRTSRAERNHALRDGLSQRKGAPASIGRRDFEEKALRLLKPARAALIHLALAMHSEEPRRQRASRSKRPTFGQSLPIMEQARKV